MIQSRVEFTKEEHRFYWKTDILTKSLPKQHFIFLKSKLQILPTLDLRGRIKAFPQTLHFSDSNYEFGSRDKLVRES